MLRYEYVSESSRKFWEIYPVDQDGGDFIVRVRFGRLGTSGQEHIKVFSYSSGAARYRQEKITEKVRKGYRLKSSPVIVPKVQTVTPKPAPCAHDTLARKGNAYECVKCKKNVEFDKPQDDLAAPALQQKVRRYFDRSVPA